MDKGPEGPADFFWCPCAVARQQSGTIGTSSGQTTCPGKIRAQPPWILTLMKKGQEGQGVFQFSSREPPRPSGGAGVVGFTGRKMHGPSHYKKTVSHLSRRQKLPANPHGCWILAGQVGVSRLWFGLSCGTWWAAGMAPGVDGNTGDIKHPAHPHRA